MLTQCHFCQKLAQDDKLLIHEFEHAVWYLADNQYYRGYSILVSKQHVREWHEIPSNIAQSINENLQAMGKIITNTYNSHKINLASFGNVVEHLHWHVVPRYLSDPNHTQAPDLSGRTLPQQVIPIDQFEQLIKTLKQAAAKL